MTLANNIRLIPRYHWEYGISDVWKAILSRDAPERTSSAELNEILGGQVSFTTSGRASLYAILRSLALPEGSRVGVPLFCCSVVFDAIMQAGLKPEFIDITGDTYGLSPDDVQRKRSKISALVAVHMFGHPVDMDAIRESAGGTPIIEDCAQALYSTYKGQPAGTLGDVSFFSFRSGKYVSVGEGSAIRCNSRDLQKPVSAEVNSFPDWRAHQSAAHVVSTYIKTVMYNRPWYGAVGRPLGSRLDKSLNLTAKSGFTLRKIASGDFRILRERMRTFRSRIQKQRENALLLLDAIKLSGVTLPFEKTGCQSNYYQFAIRLNDQDQRDRLANHLQRRGIDAARYLDGIDRDAERLYGYAGGCPVAEHCSKTVLTIPAYYSLSKKDVQHIIQSINVFSG